MIATAGFAAIAGSIAGALAPAKALFVSRGALIRTENWEPQLDLVLQAALTWQQVSVISSSQLSVPGSQLR
jgi:hypothetical protein